MEEGKLGHLIGEVIKLATNDPSLNGYMKIPLSLRGSSILWSQQLGSLIFFYQQPRIFGRLCETIIQIWRIRLKSLI